MSLTKEQTCDVLAYDPMRHNPDVFSQVTMEEHLDDFFYFVRQRASRVEWQERYRQLEEQRWSGLSLVDREMVMDNANNEAMNNHRIRVMMEVERLNQFSTELAMVMAEQVKTLIGNSRIEDIAALEDVVRNHRGFLASAKCGGLPFSQSQREYILSIPFAGDEERGTVDLPSDASCEKPAVDPLS